MQLLEGVIETRPAPDYHGIEMVALMDANRLLPRYVRAGGGLVLAGDAARVPALAALAAAVPGPLVLDSGGAVVPLARPRPDAVPLAVRRVDGRPVLVAAARRAGAGRVRRGY